MSGRDTTGLVIGGEPRIDFLPPEVKERKQARKTRRGLIALVLVVVVACAGGYVFATSLAVQAQVTLADEQAKTAALLNEQSEYAEVRSVSAQLEAVRDARLVATAREILWKAHLADLRSSLPKGVVITEADVDSMSATDLPPLVTVPLEKERAATVSLTATAPTLSSIAAWLDSLRGLRGFADVWATPATWSGDHYEVDVRVNINAGAFEKRFFQAPEEEAASEGAAVTEADQGESIDEAPEPESTETPDDSSTTAPSAPPLGDEG